MVRLLPGVIAARDRATEPAVRLWAAQLWAPRSVLLGRAAMSARGMGTLADRVEVAVPSRRAPQRGYWFVKGLPGDVEEVAGLRCVTAAHAAAWLAAWDGGAAIDDCLREGIPLSEIQEAAGQLHGSHHQPVRLAVIRDSRDEPWSPAERAAHALLRGARLLGWSTNVALELPRGRTVVDILFERERLVVEIDGWEYHGDRDAFETDRERTAELVAAGWTVLRFSAAQIFDRSEWVLTQVLAVLPRSAGGRW